VQIIDANERTAAERSDHGRTGHELLLTATEA